MNQTPSTVTEPKQTLTRGVFGSTDLLSICVTVEGTTSQDVWANLLSLVITACKHKQEHGGIWPVKVETPAGKVEITGLTMQASTHTVTGMNTTITNRIRNVVPECVLKALSQRQGYTDMRDVFHCIELDKDHWVGVAGDGNNGSYESFSVKAERDYDGEIIGVKSEFSDCGYGMTEVALRDVLNCEVPK